MKINDNFAINVLMRREAILGVKEQLRRQGVRVSLVHCAEIHRLARAYLEQNEAALLTQARAKWEKINGYRGGNGVVSPAPVRGA